MSNCDHSTNMIPPGNICFYCGRINWDFVWIVGGDEEEEESDVLERI